MDRIAFLVDFGSTFTKLTAVDLDRGCFIGRTQAPSSVDTDIRIGLQHAWRQMEQQHRPMEPAFIQASSSAAGGLRMVAIGLVPNLTVKAAQEAALGAGAKLIKSYAFELSRQDVAEIEDIAPDMLLLTGGTDGGNKEVIQFNTRQLAKSTIAAPIVIAGNRVVSEDIAGCLEAAGKHVVVTDNVMPEFSRLEVGPARTAIREIFMNRIVHAKGLDGAREMVGDVVMPTPMAVLEAARLVAEGIDGQSGMGELLLVDVGGATTDLHSIADGSPSTPNTMLRGLPEPFAKRTVEGDLGIRINAASILDMAQMQPELFQTAPADQAALEKHVTFLSHHTEALPADAFQSEVDAWLARTAVEAASIRHAGEIEILYTANGQITVQAGKDLRPVEVVIGTGGVLSCGESSGEILKGVCFSERYPHSLRPESPSFYVDRHYVFYAIGLLAQVEPAIALELARETLTAI